MTEQRRVAIREELAERTPTDSGGFFAWWGLAARLAALGDESVFSTWPSVVRQLGLDLDSGLRRRSSEGIEDLESQTGEVLALAATDAQDLAFAHNLSADILPASGRLALEDWISRVQHTDFDEAAVTAIEEWRERNYLDRALCLPAVAHPLTGFERFLVASSSPDWVNLESSWPPAMELPTHLSPVGVIGAVPVHLDDGDAPTELRQRWRRTLVVNLPDGREIRVVRSLNEDWDVVVLFEGAIEVIAVSLGSLGLTRTNDQDEVRWHTSFGILPRNERLTRLDAPLRIRTADGFRLVLS